MTRLASPLALLLLTLALHVSGTWALPLLDRDEPRFAEASREMRERSDYVVPYFNGLPRLDKPPLIYWCQVACYRVFGENTFAARFPSALAAALTSLVLFLWGRALKDDRLGLSAALVFATSHQVFLHARAAVADMAMVFCFTSASWAGWELLRSKTERCGVRNPFWWIFYVALEAGFLAKGPVALLPIGTVLLFARGSARHAFHFGWGAAFLLGLVGLWGVPALIRTHGDFFYVGIGRHVIGRSLSVMEGHGAQGALSYFALLPLYFLTVFASFFPWSIWLPKVARSFRNWDDADKYLVTGALLVFAVFTPLKTKLPHYTLPALPLLSLLFVRWWFREGRSMRTLHWCVSAMLALGLLLSLAGPPFMRSQFPARQLFEKSEPWLSADMDLGAVEFQEPSLVWEFRRKIHGLMHPLSVSEARKFLLSPGPHLLVLPTGSLPAAFDFLDPEWKTVRSAGFNISRGETVDLTLIIKTR